MWSKHHKCQTDPELMNVPYDINVKDDFSSPLSLSLLKSHCTQDMMWSYIKHKIGKTFLAQPFYSESHRNKTAAENSNYPHCTPASFSMESWMCVLAACCCSLLARFLLRCTSSTKFLIATWASIKQHREYFCSARLQHIFFPKVQCWPATISFLIIAIQR